MTMNKKKISRRSFLKAIGSGAAVMAAEPVVRPLGGFWAQEKSPIVIGHQCDYTGMLAGWGYWMDLAAKYAIKQVNDAGGINGRTVEYIMGDTASDPATGTRELRSLIQKSNADFVIGCIHAGPATGSLPIAKELKTIYFMQSSSDEVITKFGSRYTFMGGGVEISKITYGVPWAVKNLGKKFTFCVYDMAWGYTHVDGSTPIIEKMGGKVIDKIFVPLGTKDFYPYLRKISPETEVLYGVFSGPPALGFLTQTFEIGLHKKMKRYVDVGVMEGFNTEKIGGVAEDCWYMTFFPRRLKFKDTENVRKLRKAINVDDDGVEIGGQRVLCGSRYWAAYENVFWIKRAIEKSGWKSKKDNPVFIEALEGMCVKEGPEFIQGDKCMRAKDHFILHDLWMGHVENNKMEEKTKFSFTEEPYPALVDYTKDKL
jgi:branched-chain amino acid transport system substrate-binding protein